MKPQSISTGRTNRGHHATGYSRREVLRILQLKSGQLASWERLGLVLVKDRYHFGDLGLLRVVRDLRATRITARTICASVLAMKRYTGMRDPLIEASALRRGSQVEFRYAGSLLNPITLQLAFDFGSGAELVEAGVQRGTVDPMLQSMELQELFQRAVQIEEESGRIEEAAEIYRGILQTNAQHAPASINLGTIHYNRREFGRAEALYRQATVADPEYALAFFDLGNVLDETLQLDGAVAAYQRAVELVPRYADAHYNLALAYERQGEQRRALRHWLIYARLDPVGPWANHAKCQARKILNGERLSIVSRRGRTVSIAG